MIMSPDEITRIRVKNDHRFVRNGREVTAAEIYANYITMTLPLHPTPNQLPKN